MTDKVPQRLDEQSGADQQEDRQPDLAGHEHAAEPPGALRRCRRLARPESAPSRSTAVARHAGASPNSSALTSDAPAANPRMRASAWNASPSGTDGSGSIERMIETPHRADTASAHSPPSVARSAPSTKVLQNQPRPGRAERNPYRQLTPSRRVSHHEQVADVRARHQQHESTSTVSASSGRLYCPRSWDSPLPADRSSSRIPSSTARVAVPGRAAGRALPTRPGPARH